MRIIDKNVNKQKNQFLSRSEESSAICAQIPHHVGDVMQQQSRINILGEDAIQKQQNQGVKVLAVPFHSIKYLLLFVFSLYEEIDIDTLSFTFYL